jgi:hypothetical protein
MEEEQASLAAQSYQQYRCYDATADAACALLRQNRQGPAPRLVSVAKLVDFERGQVSYADFIDITVLSRK